MITFVISLKKSNIILALASCAPVHFFCLFKINYLYYFKTASNLSNDAGNVNVFFYFLSWLKGVNVQSLARTCNNGVLNCSRSDSSKNSVVLNRLKLFTSWDFQGLPSTSICTVWQLTLSCFNYKSKKTIRKKTASSPQPWVIFLIFKMA